jgi:hypothetical protein
MKFPLSALLTIIAMSLVALNNGYELSNHILIEHDRCVVAKN